MDLSIIIPSRNEQFLQKTIQDALDNIEGDTEIIAVLDGLWSNPAIPQHPKVSVIYHPFSVGQRAAANDAVKLARGRYIMKVDAHCSFPKGFDTVLIRDMQPNWVMAPTMRNLHAYDWVCKTCGNRIYQGPTPTVCAKCQAPREFEKDILWIAKRSPQSSSFCFDPEPHFQYFNDWVKRPEGQGTITESMSLQGSCFIISKQSYEELDICEEAFGIWGSQGIEVACKAWLSGMEVRIDRNTYYAHMFRTQGGDFGFPYFLPGTQVDHAKAYARKLFFEGQWKHMIRPASWLVKKFWPIRARVSWTDKDLENLERLEQSGNHILYR